MNRANNEIIRDFMIMFLPGTEYYLLLRFKGIVQEIKYYIFIIIPYKLRKRIVQNLVNLF